MKKTDNMKLVLVGLTSLLSTGAMAKVGDVFPSKGLVCIEKEGNTAVVVGVSNTSTLIIIPSEVINPFEGGREGKKLSVNEIHPKWYGEQTWEYSGPVQESVTTPDVRTFGPVTLQVEAAGLTYIDPLALNQVTNIENFYVTATAGLTKIGDYSFHANQTVTDVAQVARNEAAKAKAIAEAEAALAGTDADAVKDGKFQGKQVYQLVGSETLVILGDATDKKDLWDVTLCKVLRINADGTTEELEGQLLRAHSSGDFLMNDSEDKSITHRAEKFTGNFGTVHTNGLADNLADAEAALAAAKQDEKDAAKAKTIADYYALNPDAQPGLTPEILLKGQQAERLKAAIAAFGKNKSWKSLQTLVSKKTGTNVKLVDEWYAAYVLANDYPGYQLVGLTKPDQWNPLVTEFIDAYTAFYGKAPHVVATKTVEAYKFNSFNASGDIFHAGQATVEPTDVTP